MAEEQVVVVTGASSGIGRDVARRFAKRHARVVLVSRRREALEEVAAECRRAGASGTAVVPADVGEPAEVQEVVDTTIAHFGRIDVWVNDAGIDAYGPLDRMEAEDIRRVLETNAVGTALGTRAALRAMKPAGRGTIVNVASILGEVPQPYAAVYSASKAAIRALSTAVRGELRLEGHRRIHVSTVLPATIDTPVFRQSVNRSGRRVRALPPVYPVSTASKAIVRAARRHPREITAGSAGLGFAVMHRAFPRATESELALLTKGAQFTPERADATSGNAFAPFPDEDASVGGGWGGGIRHRARQLLLLGMLAAPVLVFLRATRRGRKGSKR